MSAWIVPYLWLIPAVPLVAALVGIMLGASQKKAAVGLAVGGQIGALLLSLCAFAHTLAEPGWRAVHNFTWFHFGDQSLRIGWLLDPLTAAMLVMVTFVGLGIFVFSSGYMDEDKHKTRFFAYLSFFSAAMLGLLVSNSLLLLFVCWELVGLASYLLIGFWIHKPSAAAAAKKAFITTRIGDIGFLLGIVWLFGDTGTTLFYTADGGGCLEPAALALLGTSTTFIALLIFCGAVGKSGQFPLHVWLPDAMEGPTPVSALIHAATMVAAGVFLVARVFPLFEFGAVDHVTPALTVVVWTGVVTAIMAALIAIAQNDIKRILAYSTVSQLGLMMVSLGVGGVAAGIMHLLAHGFFKALLFLGSGSIIYGCHHEQDIRRMGGLRKLMPVTFITYAIGMMALSGVPLFFAGAWTKEEILHETAHWSASHVPHYLMLLGVVLTALYMTRQMIYVFYGERREAAAKAHESPKVMTLPLMVLAACTVLGSAILSPAWPWLHSFLDGVPVHGGHLSLPAIGQALGLVALGIGLGILIYRGSGATDPLEQKQPGLYRMLENKFWIDEIYAKTILAWTTGAARWSDWMDRVVWDGLSRLVGGLGKGFSFLAAAFDEQGVNPISSLGGDLTKDLGVQVSRLHSGRIQVYLGVIAVGALALLLLFVWLT
jgi:NADH-quinone oxidoreductase subunit L